MKRQFIKRINGKYQTNKHKKKSNILLFNDMINIKNVHSNLLKIDGNHTKALIFTTLDTSK